MTARGGHKKEWKEIFPSTSEMALLRRGENRRIFLLFFCVYASGNSTKASRIST